MSDTIPPFTPRPDTPAADTMPPTSKDAFERPAAPDRPGERIPRKFGRYQIGDCLGKGGMGAVFKAHDTQLDRQVALKVPFLGDDGAETRERFYREARAAATLQHANICPVFDVGEYAGFPYLTMAFIEGRSLAQARAAGQAFSNVQIAVLVRKLALAMHEAHSKGVIHRDLKPANVLLRAANEPTIMDFGLARRSDDKKSRGLTQQGDILGTVDYMSKEQVEGKNDKVGPASDIYSLGVMLYELLTGRLPFEGPTTTILAYIIVKEPPRPSELRPDVPPKLEEICLKAMAKEPADRFATMGQFAAALGDYLRSFAQSASTTITRAADAATVRPAPPPVIETQQPPPEEHPSRVVRKSGLRSSKRSRSSSRRKTKAQQSSNVPLILGVVVAVLAVGGMLSAAIIFWPSGNKTANSALATGIAPLSNPAIVKGPPGANPTNRPSTPNVGQPTNPTPTPRTLGFALKVQPDAVTMTLGTPARVNLKVERQDYQGPINLTWTAPNGVRVSPIGPVTIQAGQADPVLTLMVLSAPPEPSLRLNITAKPAQETQRGSTAVSLSVNVSPGPCVRVIEIGDKPAGTIESMAFTPGATMALVGGGAGKMEGPNANQAEEKNAIQVWSLERGEWMSALNGHTNKVLGLAISADGRMGLSVGADDIMSTWDLSVGKRKQQSPKQLLRVIGGAMSADGRRALLAYTGTATTSGLVVIVNLDNNFLTMHQPINSAVLLGTRVEDAVRATAISPDKKLGLIGGVNGKAFLIDMIKATKPKPLSGHTEAVSCAAFSPSSGFVATGGGGVLQVGKLQPGKDNAIRLWNTSTATLEWMAEGHTKSVATLAFSTDGKYLASSDVDGEMRIWDAESGKPIAVFVGHTKRVLALAFVPDQKVFWTGSADRTFRQWRLP